MTLKSLAALNSQLIAQTTGEPEDNPLVGGDQPVQVEVVEEETPDEFKGFSSTNKLEFERVVEWIENSLGDQVSGMSTLVDAFVNEWAVEWRQEQGLSPLDQIDRTPTAEDLIGRNDFVNGTIWLPVTGSGQLPPLFTTELAAEPDEEGEEPGEPVSMVATTDPLKGVEFRTVEQVAARESLDAVKAYREVTVRSPQSELAQELRREAFSTVRGEATESVNVGHPGGPVSRVTRRVSGGPARPGGSLGPEAPGGVGAGGPIVVRESERPDKPPVPHISQDELQTIVSQPQPTRRGGGGGGTRREIAFDRDHLIERTENRWKTWFRQPPDSKRVGNIVDQYMREARAFWSGKGGKLDFDTFTRNKLRNQPRYQTMFRDKPPDQTEEQYIQSFAAPIGQLGLRPERASEETTRAITSGGSVASQTQRVSRSREAQLQGGFSQRFAQTLQGLGPGAA